MTLILPPNQCMIFFRDPEAKFTPARLKKLLRDRGLTVTGRKEPFALCCGNGPTLFVSLHRASYVESLIRRRVGRRRKHRKLIPGCDTYLLIQMADLEAALDEINTLIEVQTTLQDATRGLLYLSWNQVFAGPDD